MGGKEYFEGQEKKFFSTEWFTRRLPFSKIQAYMLFKPVAKFEVQSHPGIRDTPSDT
jgi:hypothetical protein